MSTERLKTAIIVTAVLLLFNCSSAPEGIILLCAGDSITAGDYPQFLKKMFSEEGIRVKVLNYGRSGNTSGEYLNFLRRNKKKLAEEYPDYILLQLGTNDVRVDYDSTPGEKFYLNMKKILKIFQKFKNRSGEKSRILLATIPPVPEGSTFPFSPESTRRVPEEINPLIQKISKEEKITLVDNYTFYLKSPHLLPEVHPNREGYRALAQNWFTSLKPLLKSGSINTLSLKNLKAKSPFKGKIVLQSNMDGDNEIYVLQADSLKKLTDNSWEDIFPVWSPGGDKIAFASNQNGNYDIFIMNANGSEKTKLTSSRLDEKEPSWFPDGKKIVYTEEKKALFRKKSALFILDIQSKKSQRLIPDFSSTQAIANVSPANPDWITFTGKKFAGWDVAVYFRDQNRVQFLEEKGKSCRGRFSGDGKKIAYVNSLADGKGDIWIMNPDGTSKKRLTVRDETYDYFPSWSPDGKDIVFSSSLQHEHEGNWALYILEVSTGKTHLLFDSPGNDIFPDWTR